MARQREIVISLRLSSEEHAFLNQLAEQEDRTPGQTLRWLLLREQRGEQKPTRPARKPRAVEYAQ
jgi:hypothetical protein